MNKRNIVKASLLSTVTSLILLTLASATSPATDNNNRHRSKSCRRPNCDYKRVFDTTGRIKLGISAHGFEFYWAFDPRLYLDSIRNMSGIHCCWRLGRNRRPAIEQSPVDNHLIQDHFNQSVSPILRNFQCPIHCYRGLLHVVHPELGLADSSFSDRVHHRCGIISSLMVLASDSADPFLFLHQH